MRSLFAALLLAAGIAFPATAATTWHVRAHVFLGEDEVDIYRYTPAVFDDEAACKAFLAAPTEQFTTSTKNLTQSAEAQGLKVVVKCEQDPE